MKERFLEVSQEAGAALFARNISGEVVMLNLLRFRDTAEYSTNPELMPSEPISGAEAYQKYIDHTLPFLKESGGDLVFWAKVVNTLSGRKKTYGILSCLFVRNRYPISWYLHQIQSAWQVWHVERQHSKIRGCYHLLNRNRQHNEAGFVQHRD